MDVVSDILELVKISSSIYFNSHFLAPWGMEAPSSTFAQFHLVVSNCAVLCLSNGEEINLNEGDIALIPHGSAHTISDRSKTRVLHGSKVVEDVALGNSPFTKGENGTTLICGHFEFENELKHQFITDLPEYILITNKEHKQQAWFETIYALFVNETSGNLPGSKAIAIRLAEVMLLQVLRTFLIREQQSNAFYLAFTHKQLSLALHKIHTQPSFRWSLSRLAKEAGMSRTLFATTFRTKVGTTPMEYVSHWRMLKAKELLIKSTHSIAYIASQVGYGSEAAFTRAFKRHVKKTPLLFRKLN